MKDSMEELWKAFSLPSAEMPKLSRKSIAGSCTQTTIQTKGAGL